MTPLYKPYMPEQLPELADILRSGALAYGKYARLFETRLSDWIGTPWLLTVNSHNSAALVLIKTLDLKGEDEVIASPMTCLASSQPFASLGIRLRWADIDPHTGTLNPESITSKINSKTKAIIHNHFCGNVGYIEEISRIARDNGLLLIDDAIEAFGSEWNGKKMGNLPADATIMSFQTVRLPNTIDGGALSFKNKDLFDKAVLFRDFGIDRPTFRDDINEINPECDITLAGVGATPSDVNSYIGLCQIDSLDELIARQRHNLSIWPDLLSGNEIPVSITPGSNPNGWIFGMLSENKRDSIIKWRQKGFYASGVHLPNNYYSVFGDKSMLPGVSEFYSGFVALPSGWWVNL